jgi:hypothetical protein
MPYRPSGVAPQAARASTSEELQEESGRLQRKSEDEERQALQRVKSTRWKHRSGTHGTASTPRPMTARRARHNTPSLYVYGLLYHSQAHGTHRRWRT